MRSATWTFGCVFLFVAAMCWLALLAGRWPAAEEGYENLDELVSARGIIRGPAAAPLASLQHPPGEQATDAREHPLDPLLQVARRLEQHMHENIRDYSASLVKRERIHGKLGEETRMQVKVRNPQQTAAGKLPLAAYLKFTYPASVKGREVIWVAGQNDNRLISHESGFLNLKRFNLEPTGMLAMLGNKYPITEIGMLRLVEKLIEKGERDRELGLCEVEVIDGQRVGDRECRLYQVIHPEASAGFDFHIAQIFVDVDRNIPLRYAAFMWPQASGEDPPLEEEYTYLDVQLNIGLSAEEFDPDNPEYDFP